MKAMRYHSFGPPELLQEDEIPPPAAGPGQVLVQTAAVGVNGADWKLGLGLFKEQVKLPVPFIPGLDFSGVVIELGEGVTGFSPGDAVYGCTPFDQAGTYAEVIAVPAAAMAPAPGSIPLAAAAAVPIAALTAWGALLAQDQGHLEPGQSVLIHGAAGGVGTFAVQLARWRGARVIATASAENHDYLRGLGAHETLDYRTTRFEDAVHGLQPAPGLDVVLDLVGGDVPARALPLVRPGGALVSAVAFPTPELKKQAESQGVRVSFAHVMRDPKVLQQVTALIDAGTLQVVVTQQYPFAQARQALASNREGHTRGKAVLVIAGQ